MNDDDDRRGWALGELAIALLVLALLGVAGGATFSRYAQRTRTNEAMDKLAYLFRASATYVTSERPGSTAVAMKFPEGCGPTPALARIGRRRVVDPPGTWDTPTWQALAFSVSDPHWYAYSYDSSGQGTAAGFTARANGDLDGDRTYSTFERSGHVNANYEVEGSVGVRQVRPLE